MVDYYLTYVQSHLKRLLVSLNTLGHFVNVQQIKGIVHQAVGIFQVMLAENILCVKEGLAEQQLCQGKVPSNDAGFAYDKCQMH